MSVEAPPAIAVGRTARRSWVVARHTAILLVRDPGTVIAYTVMAVVLLTVLRPLYERLGTFGGPAIDQEAPGTAVMFTLLALDVAGQNLLSERTWHTWDRLRAGAVGIPAVLAGKTMPLVALFAIQQATLFAFAAAVFGFDVTGGSWRLALVVAVWSVCVACLGLAVGAWVRSQGQLSAAADVGALAVTCLSGSLVPLAILPHWVAHVAPWTPGYWALRGFQSAVEGDQAMFAKTVGVLAVISVPAFGLAVAGSRRAVRRDG